MIIVGHNDKKDKYGKFIELETVYARKEDEQFFQRWN